MTTDVTLPALGESVTEGTVTRWLKQVGDTVAVDEPLVEVSTDKVDTEIPSPVAGTILEILAAEDDTVEVGAVLARVGDPSEAGGAPAAPAAPAPVAAAPAEAAPAPAPAAVAPAEPVAAPAPAPAPAAAPAGDATDVTLPALGESVTEGTVTRWLKQVGDTVAVDEPLVEVSTDKVDTEIPSPVAGTILEILAAEDDTVEVGAVLARVGSGVAAAAPAAAPAPASAAAAPVASAAPAAAAPVASTGSGYVTPIVRKLAAERGVDLGTVAGTGVGGRIRKEDVLAAPVAAAAPAAPAAPAPAAPAPAPAPAAPAAAPAPASAAGASASLRGQTVKMTRIRKVTADKMMESLHGMAQLTSVVEVDCSAIWSLRARAKDAFEAQHGTKLSFLPFFTKAVAEALAEHPNINASIVDDSIAYHADVNLSLAVDTPKGLMLPTLRNADTKTLAQHAQGIADLANRARNGGLSADEISGGTFSVTNTGSLGTLFDTPVVPAPQAGILATCAIIKRAVVVKGPQGEDVISVRPMCFLPLSYDHRLVDGADAARFLQSVKKRIEEGNFAAELGL